MTRTRLLRPTALAALALLTVVGAAGCSSDSSEGISDDSASQAEPSAQPSAEPLDLVGEWEQSNKNSEDSYQAATITADMITVNWVTDGGDTTSLYWAGTYEAPTDAADSFEWDSVNDKEQTDVALLASGDETKTFTFDGDVLSYSVTAMGTTTKVELAKQ